MTRTRVFVSTEAGAKGLNLQFCDTLVNYDLPWNPQRIEQRIGRCHRYGQTRDVTVINFLAKDNEAQQLTFDILSRKLDLFGTVLDASDNVLHESGTQMHDTVVGVLGADFETRLRRIYERARTRDDIDAGLRALRDATEESRAAFQDVHKRTAGLIEQHFDESVRQAFRRIRDTMHAELAEFDRDLDRVVTGYLASIGAPYERTAGPGHIVIRIAPNKALPPELHDGLEVGIGHASSLGEASPLHLGHPLVGAAVAEARSAEPTEHTVQFASGGSLGLTTGQRGRFIVLRIRYEGFERVERLVPVVLVEGSAEPIMGDKARAPLEADVRDTSPLDPPLAISEEDVDDAIEEILFLDEQEVTGDEEERFSRAMEQLERFVDDRVLVARRHRDGLMKRVTAAETKRDAAVGAGLRTSAEDALRKVQEQLDEIEEELNRLTAREDADYRRWRERAHGRRYVTPQFERIIDVEFQVE